MKEEKMKEEKVTEEKVTEEKETEEEKTEEVKTEGKIYEVDSGKLVTLHALMKECVTLARETLEGEFGELVTVNVDNMAETTATLAIALFHKVSIPDQTETMMIALERGLEWYGQWQEEQKAESAKIDAEFKKSIGMVMPKPPRIATALEILVRNLIDFTSRFAEVELTKLSDEMEEARETVTAGEVPTPEE